MPAGCGHGEAPRVRRQCVSLGASMRGGEPVRVWKRIRQRGRLRPSDHPLPGAVQAGGVKTERLRVAGAIAAEHAFVVAPPQARASAADDALAPSARIPGVLGETVAAECALYSAFNFSGPDFHPNSLGAKAFSSTRRGDALPQGVSRLLEGGSWNRFPDSRITRPAVGLALLPAVPSRAGYPQSASRH